MFIGFNGRVVDEREAVVSVLDHGFLYGMGCFETFRTYGSRPFLFEQHMDRLEQSCAALGIVLEVDRKAALSHIAELMQANRYDEAYIRYSVSAGEGVVGLPTEDYGSPNAIVYMKELAPIQHGVMTADRSLQLLKLPRNSPEGELRLKSFHYMNNILAKREMRAYPWATNAEGLLLTADGRLAEGVVSNLFMVKQGGNVRTPALSTGILPGITRAFVMELIQSQGWGVVAEGEYSLEELLGCDEIFMTNSVQEIVGIERVYDPTGAIVWVRDSKETFVESLQRLYRTEIEKGGGAG